LGQRIGDADHHLALQVAGHRQGRAPGRVPGRGYDHDRLPRRGVVVSALEWEVAVGPPGPQLVADANGALFRSRADRDRPTDRRQPHGQRLALRTRTSEHTDTHHYTLAR